MSVAPVMGSLLKGARTRLQAVLGKDSKWIDIDPETRPTPVMPDWKASLGPGSIQRVEGNEQYLVRSLGINVNITKRLTYIPTDLREYGYLYQVQSIEMLSEQVIGILMSRAVITAANTELATYYSASPVNGSVEPFIKPLVFSSASEVTVEDGSWSDSAPDKGSFLVQRLRFDGAIIIQQISNLITNATPAA